MGLLIPVGIALIAYRAHALNLSGTIAAAVLGTVVFGLGGVGWALIMLTFFFPPVVYPNFLQYARNLQV